MDAPASSELTQQRLGWRPTEEPGFLADLERSSAFEVVSGDVVENLEEGRPAELRL